MTKTHGLGAALVVIAAARLVIACGGSDDSSSGAADAGSADAATKMDATTSTGGDGGGGGGADGGGADGGLTDGGTAADGSTLPDGAVADAGAAGDAGDAGIFDASGFPPGLTACATCYADTCEPQAAACQADVYCEDLFVCYVASGCQAAADPQTCITACATDAGLTTKETVEAAQLLAAVATACSSCLAECPKPDGGAP